MNAIRRSALELLSRISAPLLGALCACLIMSGAAHAQAASDETRAIAKEAFIYAYPMLFNYKTLYQQTVDKQSNSYVGGFGRFRHYSQPYGPQNKDIVTPNNDTPYSWVWLDLRREPWVLSVPAIPTSATTCFSGSTSSRTTSRTSDRARRVRRPVTICSRDRTGTARRRRASTGCSARRPISSSRSGVRRSTVRRMSRTCSAFSSSTRSRRFPRSSTRRRRRHARCQLSEVGRGARDVDRFHCLPELPAAIHAAGERV